MSLRATLLPLALAALATIVPAATQAPTPTTAPRATVATHYFYWYHWPTEHFNEPGAPGHEGHRRHLPGPEKVSYRSADWHAKNFAQMAEAGIDVALPVYWGAPGAYQRPNLAFSRLGLPPMVAALDRLAGEPDDSSRTPPKLGLFYDTSTLHNDVCGRAPQGGRTDLTTDAGRELFCTTVTDYFAAIPQRHWARHRGGALVVLYVGAFAAKWDETLGATLRERFAARFPDETTCLVADASWGEIGQDLTTSWGAALWGPKLFRGTAQIGPGYDDSPVPGRRTPLREREDGAFYAFSWQAALRHRPELVLLETWNELHEGTELCPTIEAGRQYLELTAEWVDRLRALEGGAELAEVLGEPIVLRWPEPRARPDLSWGEEAKGRNEVAADYATGRRVGLREVACEDGALRLDDGALRAGQVAGDLGNYLYFQVSDHFAFEADADFVLEVRHRPGDDLRLQFDSRDATATLAGAYTPCAGEVTRRDGDWAVSTFALRRARFANRQNGGADLRFFVPRRAATIRDVVLRRAPTPVR